MSKNKQNEETIKEYRDFKSFLKDSRAKIDGNKGKNDGIVVKAKPKNEKNDVKEESK